MNDVIQLLPDHIANQIAAGEVVQRPASVVKELVENAVDAGATKITLRIKEAGKTLIQVIDNGCGMSKHDARMAFERHATSKIHSAEDIFHIQTKGFRGEALASIAAVAQVELKTKRAKDELGQHVVINGSDVQKHEEVICDNGTQFIIKNLFYNIPARRNFLKSNTVENKHVFTEFQRVALTHPEIHFELYSNEQLVYNLPVSNLRQRIVNVFGDKYNERLAPISTETDYVDIKGFIVKPEYSKKSKNEQYFFVNERFIRSNYLNHAIASAYEDLLQEKQYPSFFIYLQIDPGQIDINVHPTKTEIKFEDEATLYAMLRSTVKKALGQFNIAPSLDFTQDDHFSQIPLPKQGRDVPEPKIEVDESYNPFAISQEAPTPKSDIRTPRSSGGSSQKSMNAWASGSAFNTESFDTEKEIEAQYIENIEVEDTAEAQGALEVDGNHFQVMGQIQNKYILIQREQGLYYIHQSRAHQRILYERTIHLLATQKLETQSLLFPAQIELSPEALMNYEAIKDVLEKMAFEIDFLGKNTLVLNGVPAVLGDENWDMVLGQIINDLDVEAHSGFALTDELCKRVVFGAAMRTGKSLSLPEMQQLVSDLLECESPKYAPNGKNVIYHLSFDELNHKFGL